MELILKALGTLFSVLIYPGFLFVSAVGLLLAGFDRKVLARMQKRVGPPLLQPAYDFFKLLGKETLVPSRANKAVFLAAPVIGTASLAVMMLFLPIFGRAPLSLRADLIVILYLLTIPAVALILGGSASGSPFAGIGISREMVVMMAYELPLILVFLAVARKTGGSELCFSLERIVAWQAEHGPLLFHWAMIPAALAMLFVIPAEVGTQPFDAAEAETEICEGPLIEYSGAPLGLFKLNTAIKMFLMTALFCTLFLGGSGVTVTLGPIWLGAALSALLNTLILLALCLAVTLLCMTLVHAVTARLKIEHLFRFYWTVVAGLALISLILVWLGL
ncbi:MAG: NADH-quinone oxidoreductase subunit H [Lachnospiraceae bacterium]|nr:NADH-quinone oxidoreductase subunit H [Lachnospiraceae bacterium]